MRRSMLLYLLFTFAVSFDCFAAAKYSKLDTLMFCKGLDKQVLGLAKVIADDLHFTDQFDVKMSKSKKMQPHKDLFKKGISLVISFEKKRRFVEVKVFDTSISDHSAVVFNKKIRGSLRKRSNLVEQGHRVSSEILEKLTGDKGVCMSSIAYCKTISPQVNRPEVGWVSPFGHRRIKGCLSPPRRLSLTATSFIGLNSQGIHCLR